MTNKIYNLISTPPNRAGQFAVLLDPDKIKTPEIPEIVHQAAAANVDLLFIGGSMVIRHELIQLIEAIRKACDIPVVLFPGSTFQISEAADAILLLSLISGRNPEFLIGHHVTAAPVIRESGLEVLPTGYMLVDGGGPTTVTYVSNTAPIPHAKNEVAVCTAMAGEQLGLKLIYMDAGSGAKHAIRPEMIAAVRQSVEIPIIVGGGIRSPEAAHERARAGADVIVVGNAIENDRSLIQEMAAAVHEAPRASSS